jgi:sulfur carrier protein
MTVTINGEARDIEPGTTVTGLLEDLGLHPRLIVVEHNREILDRGEFDRTEVHEGDNFELVHFVGGG